MAIERTYHCDGPDCGRHAMMDKQRGGGQIPAGERHPSAKLTVDQVREIRALLPTVAKKELARRYGVRYQSIQKIARGANWRCAA